MNDRLSTLAAILALSVAVEPAVADHNSKNGEGWANMPNDIHNTRVETLENDENDTFRDFVKYGEGSKTINRFDSDDTRPNQGTEQNGNASITGNSARSGQTKRNQGSLNTESKRQTHDQTRSRFESAAVARSRLNRNVRSMRGADSRRGRSRP